MAEERTLGVARAESSPAEDPSKQELQRRMDEARDSISLTVTEIKETVAHQVQAVKDTLDWREQFRRRPVAWSAGALGVGFLAGYGIAAAIKGESNHEVRDSNSLPSRSYAAQPILGAPPNAPEQENGEVHDRGPGLLKRLSDTPAYERVKDEVGSVGDALVHELGKTAKQLVLPALITSLANFIGSYLPRHSETSNRTGGGSKEASNSDEAKGYQPTLERGGN